MSLVVSVPYGFEDRDCWSPKPWVVCADYFCFERNELVLRDGAFWCSRHLPGALPVRGEAGRPASMHGHGLWPLPSLP